ncbi:MAG: DUF4232 domain-containing protein, partial [Candidatus Dormibacteraeota bacterium]|nr:DUF4232 domain-containing protein [Candidatus Dormibacteraeota bacterium]
VVTGFLITACSSSPQSRNPPGGTPPPTAPPSSSPAPLATPSATPAPPAATPAPSSAPPASGAVYRCLVSQLSLSAGSGNAAAGTVGRALIFTNTSQTTCALFGYPGLQRLDGDGRPVQTRVVWTPSPEQTVTLAPGGTASFLAWWHDQTGYATPCATSQQLEVTPPNAYSHLIITVPIQACPDGTINVNAVIAGSSGGQPH